MSATQIDIDAIGAAGTELARYRTSECERVLIGWRRVGGVEVTDRPAHGRHRAYLVDRGFQGFEQLQAFVGEYLDQARRLDACPMSAEAIGGLVEETETEIAEELAAAIGRG
jgi:hypothetical protein